VRNLLPLFAKKCNPDQPGDDKGRWGTGGAIADALKNAVPQLQHFKHTDPKPERWVRGEKRPADPHHWLYASTHVNSGNPVTRQQA
jgi:hypothetical protein